MNLHASTIRANHICAPKLLRSPSISGSCDHGNSAKHVKHIHSSSSTADSNVLSLDACLTLAGLPPVAQGGARGVASPSSGSPSATMGHCSRFIEGGSIGRCKFDSPSEPPSIKARRGGGSTVPSEKTQGAGSFPACCTETCAGSLPAG